MTNIIDLTNDELAIIKTAMKVTLLVYEDQVEHGIKQDQTTVKVIGEMKELIRRIDEKFNISNT